MKTIKGHNIELAYGEKVIIHDLDIEITKGEVVSIIGTNGCGKSTLLKAISRVLPCRNGNIYLDGEEISSIKNKIGRAHV